MAERKVRFWVFVAAVILSIPLIAANRSEPIVLELSGTEIALIITALSTLCGVVGGIVVQLRGQNESRKARLELSNKMEAIKTATDGVVTRLGDAKLAQGTAEGHAVGLEQGRDENK